MRLAAHDKGLGTCQSTTLVRYPGLLRQLLPGAEGQRMVIAVTLGYPDLDAPADTFERSRADLDGIVTWVSVEPGRAHHAGGRAPAPAAAAWR